MSEGMPKDPGLTDTEVSLLLHAMSQGEEIQDPEPCDLCGKFECDGSCQSITRRLLIDDARFDKKDIYGIPLCDVVVRNPMDGILALGNFGPFDELYLDHDMGKKEKYIHAVPSRERFSRVTAWITDKPEYHEPVFSHDGYGVLCFIEMFPQYQPRLVVLVTDNSSAFVKMSKALESMGYKQTGRGFEK